MGNIINKSNHPIEVKKIQVEVWSLRDEIEYSISKRIIDTATDVDTVDIEDIKAFYSSLNTQLQQSSANDEEAGNLDPSGNPMDDDANAMMALLEGGKDDETDDEADDGAEEQGPQGAVIDTKDAEGETADDEAEAMALAMLADQGVSTPNEADQKIDNTAVDQYERLDPPSDKKCSGYIFLGDIQMEQALIFTRSNFTQGQTIIVKLMIPDSFSLSGEVIASSDLGRKSRIISSTKADNRLQMSIKFLFDNERHTLREFLKSIEPTIPPMPQKMKKNDDDGTDDEFDDLGF